MEHECYCRGPLWLDDTACRLPYRRGEIPYASGYRAFIRRRRSCSTAGACCALERGCHVYRRLEHAAPRGACPFGLSARLWPADDDDAWSVIAQGKAARPRDRLGAFNARGVGARAAGPWLAGSAVQVAGAVRLVHWGDKGLAATSNFGGRACITALPRAPPPMRWPAIGSGLLAKCSRERSSENFITTFWRRRGDFGRAAR